MTHKTRITIQTTINASPKLVWEVLTEPKHIIQWNAADPSWHTPSASVDLTIGGSFKSRMEARDGSFGFDFEGIYTDVKWLTSYAYVLGDGRKVELELIPKGNQTEVVETFDPEQENSLELQRSGWQSILDNCKTYTESLEVKP